MNSTLDKWKTGLNFETQQNKLILAFLMLSPVILYLFMIFPPDATDWYYVYYQVAKVPFQLYQYPIPYLPWVALLLAPFRFFPYRLSLAVNCYLNLFLVALLVIKNCGGKLSLQLALTSFPFACLIANGGIEWMPIIGFLIQGGWGIVFLLELPRFSGQVATWESWGTSMQSFVPVG